MPPLLRALVAAAAAIVVSRAVEAQWWLEVPAGDIPRTASGDVDVAAPAPRAVDGRPDLSGVWEPIKTYSRDLAEDLVTPSAIPYQPWAKALRGRAR